MRQPPSRPFRYRRRPYSSTSQLSGMLRNVAVLLFGVGIGIIGLDWLTPGSHSANSPAQPTSRTSDFDNPRQSNRPETQPSPQLVAGEVADATVCVRGVLPDGKQVCASGVSIDPELAGLEREEGAVIVTNFHVVANTGDRPPILLGGKGEVYNSEVIRQSPEMDLALLLIRSVQLPIAALAESSPERGTAVRAIGFPNNAPLTIKDSTLLGPINECLAIAPCLAIQQGTITHGNSGGPLEANGQVIGITEGETTEEIAIPVEQVRQFLAGQVPAGGGPQFDPGYPDPRGGPPGGYPPGGYPPGGYPGYPPGGYPPPQFGGPPSYGW